MTHRDGSWDDAETAATYEAFCENYPRYIHANRELIAHAQIADGMQILDIAAGTGRTAEAALSSLGENGSVVCFEPSPAMRAEGMRRIKDKRVSWIKNLPPSSESSPESPSQLFDRILCGASIWQMIPLIETFRTLAALLAPGGALCFNIPALYLMEPDEPGGGSDPSLLALQELLMSAAEDAFDLSQPEFHAPESGSPESAPPAPLTQDAISALLQAAGLRPFLWSFRLRISQIEYANWLKIPVLTGQLLGHLSPQARAERIDAAFVLLTPLDRDSWKWERWNGWTAWAGPRGKA